MNSIQAKKLSLPEILSRLGYEPVKVTKGGRELWYNSPFRSEKEASFHTSFLSGKWIWNDFSDKGGTVIDFIMRYEGFLRVGEALAFLKKMYGDRESDYSKNKISQKEPNFSFQQQSGESPVLKFISAGPLSNPVLLDYLIQTRKISKNIAKRYLEEVRYRNTETGKEYFAFGIKNESGGYEIRVASDKYPFKSALIKKDITVIPGSDPSARIVNVFEGMTDFLSWLTLRKVDNLIWDSILMHSLSSLGRAVDLIKENGHKAIHTYLDNDKAGRQHTEKFIREFGKSVQPKSYLFLPFEDINKFLKQAD